MPIPAFCDNELGIDIFHGERSTKCGEEINHIERFQEELQSTQIMSLAFDVCLTTTCDQNRRRVRRVSVQRAKEIDTAHRGIL